MFIITYTSISNIWKKASTWPIESPCEYVLLDQILRKFNISSIYSSYMCRVFDCVLRLSIKLPCHIIL